MDKEKLNELIKSKIIELGFFENLGRLSIEMERLFVIRNGKIVFWNRNKPITIYCLVNPKDNSIFYVGRTTKPLKHRLMFHNSIKINSRKDAVISEIKASNLRVIAKVLEVFKPICSLEYIGTHAKETEWVIKFLKDGQPITNKLNNYIKGSIED